MSEVGEQTVQVTFRGAEMTAEVLYKLIRATLEELKKSKSQAQPKEKIGQQSLKSLTKKDGNLVPVDVSGQSMKDIKAELKRDGVDFSIQKNRNNGDLTLFFKARDSAVVEHALEQQLAKAERENVLDKGKYRDAEAQNMASLDRIYGKEFTKGSATVKLSDKGQETEIKAARLRADIQKMQEKVNKTNAANRTKAPQVARKLGRER